MKLRNFIIAVNLLTFWPALAAAHVSEQGFVLLLPTGAYTAAGVAVVALTVVALFAMPPQFMQRLFSVRAVAAPNVSRAARICSLLSLGLMCGVIYLGLLNNS